MEQQKRGSDSERILKLKEKAKKISIKEGSFATVQGGFGESYITPYAIALNSSNAMIAFLSSFPGLLGPLSQWFGSRLIEKYTRKKLVLFAILFQALMWLPIMLLSFLFWKGILTGYLPLLLIVFFSAYVVFGNLASPAWFSWMGDIVEEKERGKYFSTRNRITAVISIICAVTSAFFLDFFKKHSFLLVGFSIFFFLSMIARLISRALFKKQYEPKIKLREGYYFSFWQFLRKASSNNFGKFAIFRAFFGFAVNIAAPFFAVYMLRDLQFTYATYIIITFSATVFSVLVMPLWGKFSDRFGNYQVMRITLFLIPAIPILWIFSSSPYYLILVAQLVDGIGWAGFNLASANFIYDSVTPPKRGLAVSYFNVLNGVGVFLGASLGAFLVEYVSLSFINTILFIFIISGVARLIAGFAMSSHIKEVRKVEKFDGNRALKNIVLRTVRLPMHESSHEILARKILRKGSTIPSTK